MPLNTDPEQVRQKVLDVIPEYKTFLRTSISRSDIVGVEVRNKRLLLYLETSEPLAEILSASGNRKLFNKLRIDLIIVSRNETGAD